MKKLLSILLLAFGGIFSGLVGAQEFPSRSLTLVVPFQAGGATDVLARLLSVSMNKSFGQTLVIENKPGADTRIGARFVANSQPDGYTAIILSSSGASWPLIFKEPGVDFMKELTPAGTIVDGALIIGASAKSPFNSIREMVDYAKKNPGKVTWSLSSRSGEPILYQYLLRAKTGIDMLEVVYKGSAPQAQAIIAGEVDIAQFAPGRVVAMEKAGQFKPFAISGDKRDVQLPNVPTMKELGYDGMTNYDFGLFLAAKTPSAIIDKWNAAMIAALRDPAVREGLAKFGFNPVGSSPAAHVAQMQKAFETWKVATQAVGMKPE
jgi:tripartite-type tricarboxylate transporter receptor subunit TctC